MIGEEAIFPLTTSPGDVYSLLQLLLLTIQTRTPAQRRPAGVRVTTVFRRAS
jgi:hypothetical protein